MSDERNLVTDHGTLDLTKEPPVPTGLAKISTFPFDERRFREYSRIGLAGSLVFCVIIIIVAIFWCFLVGRPIDEIKDICGMLFTPIVGLVGAVVGFYFGVERM